MDARISPGRLSGTLRIPPSKSVGHRALLCAALAEGQSVLSPLVHTDDMDATLRAVTALGARAEERGDTLRVQGIAASPAEAVIDCAESGSTLRFLIPVAAALGVRARFVGRGRLPQRPLTPLVDALEAHGVRCIQGGNEGDILTVSGRLQPGRYHIAGDISSQYITGLLYALPLLEADSEIELTSPLQSRGYVDLTLQALAAFGIRVTATGNGWTVPGNQRYQPCDTVLEGDYSSAAFWLCAGALGCDIALEGLDEQSLQGDRAVVDCLRAMGARVAFENGVLRALPPADGPLRGSNIDAAQIPDLVPVLAVTAALAQGASHITGAGRLRIKESDRLHSVTQGLRALGGLVEELDDGLFITGKPELTGGTVSSFADHRIAMAMSVAALRCREPVRVTGAECVNKSYPAFFEHLQSLGGIVDVV